MSFKFFKMDIPQVVYVEPEIHGDNRGVFFETFKSSDFKAAGIEGDVVQVNHSKSLKHVLRGVHVQREPKSQGKLVTVVSGEIFDVAVDIRRDSEFYGKWVGMELSAEKKNMLFIPRGFAHGFCVLSDAAEVIYYCVDNEYSSQHEESILWNDPDININWPVPDPILSERDKKAKKLKELF